GGLFKAIPFTTAALIIGSLSLTGIPFLTGFYSKELIIDTANTFCKYLCWIHYQQNSPNDNENNPLLTNSVKRLLAVSIFAGFITSSKIPPMTIPQITIPDYLTLTAFAVPILGFILAFEISPTTQNLKFKYPSNFFKFSNLLGISHYTPLPTILKFINESKISIMSPRFNLTRKHLTQNDFPYSNKIFYTSVRPKRPNQTIFSFIPHYPCP
ncbi:hypothetical protein DBR06_SOUSAS33610007, partial [Sousa chinensis]